MITKVKKLQQMKLLFVILALIAYISILCLNNYTHFVSWNKLSQITYIVGAAMTILLMRLIVIIERR